jgi:hypothetical protein
MWFVFFDFPASTMAGVRTGIFNLLATGADTDDLYRGCSIFIEPRRLPVPNFQCR